MTTKNNKIENFHKRYKKISNGCWEWQHGLHTNGYGHFWFNNKNNFTHRFSYEIHIGPIPTGMHVLHKCDNRKCVNPDHLFLGTQEDNMKDMVIKNRQSRLKGINHGRAKLTEQEVLEIRNSNNQIRELAQKYNVSESQISRIKSRKLWTHL